MSYMAFMIAAVGNDIEKVWRWELIENDYMGGVENVEMGGVLTCTRAF